MKRAWLALLLLACGPSGFEPPSLVSGPRLLAIVAEPPETAPGTDIVLRPLVVAPNGETITLEWNVDLSTAALAAAAGQTSVGERADPIALAWNGETALLPGATTDTAVAALLALTADAPTGTPESVVRIVYETVGLPIAVNVVGRNAEGTIVIDGFKRVVLTPASEVTTNPPPPHFSLDGRWVTGTTPFACIAEGEEPIVSVGATAILTPDEDESWLETFVALDIAGQPIEGREAAYYSWFSTGGAFSRAVTREPDRSVEWTAPDEAGDVPIWLVVRDGHLGTSACGTMVHVVP